MNAMADYWHTRYLQALSKVEASESSKARSAYLDLASHYWAMKRFCERSPGDCARHAA